MSLLVDGPAISFGEGWNIKQVGPGLYHLKYNRWPGNKFLELDLDKKVIYPITNGTFGLPADKRNISSTIPIKLESEYAPGKPFLRVDAVINSCHFSYDKENKKIDLVLAGLSITNPDEWEISQTTDDIIQFRHINLKGGFFWELDSKHAKISFLTSGEFGKLGAPGDDIAPKASAGNGAKGRSGSGAGPLQDFNLAPSRVSEWTESEKSLFSTLLIKDSYDVLVTPIQVNGNGFDRENRSLMTRYLANAIEKNTSLRLPDPTIVDKSLGEGVRNLSEDDIYRIADQVNAKMLIRGFAGHDLDEKMSITLLVQTRGTDGKLNNITKTVRLDWTNVPFSDGEPPAEAFRGLLKDIISKLPIKTKDSPAPAHFDKANLQVPDGITSFTTGRFSALENAYYLQLLGMLYPEDGSSKYVNDYYDRKPYFERSLIALAGVSPDSPDYRLLKARAWFYLRSRPAALKALGVPKTPEEKAFMAFLNGNLPEMEKWIKKFESPVDRLITQIQTNDLRVDFSEDLYDKEFEKTVVLANKGLEVLLARRLTSKDIWDTVPNAAIKKLMDQSFPIKGFEIETLLMGKLASGEDPSDDETIDLSVYNHRRKALEADMYSFSQNGGSRPVPLDRLELLYQMGEGNLWKKIRLRVSAQALYDDGKRLADAYENIYKGHLKYMYYKRLALIGLKREKHEKDILYDNEVAALKRNACYFGQDQRSMVLCDTEMFKNDYPRHWIGSDYASDRKKIKTFSIKGFDPTPLANRAHNIIKFEHDLLYTHNKPVILTNYYKELVGQGLQKQADELLRLNESRYASNPEKIEFLANLAAKSGDDKDFIEKLEKAIATSPAIWDFYSKLGTFYLNKGEYAKANAIFRKYPEFNENSGDVAYSIKAYSTGINFLNRGLVSDAQYFFSKAASNDTGAAAEFLSRAQLALLKQNLPDAAANFLRTYQRYKSTSAMQDYTTILHLAGKHDEAKAILNSIDISNMMLYPAMIGFRMDGVSEDEQMKRLTEELSKKFSEHSANYAVMGMMDRAPGRNDIGRIFTLDSTETELNITTKLLGYSYHHIRKGEYATAYAELDKFKNEHISREHGMNYENYRILVPYYTYAAVKTGNKSAALEFLNGIKAKSGEDYQYHLSMAFINGLSGKHSEALRSIEAAKNQVSDLITKPLSQWYKIVEACEWLYNENGRTEYRDMAVSLAKTYQRIMPFWAWAYAVEAKYAAPGPERTKALAMTLYLDKRSERISKIPEEEKKNALKWLDKNNPFVQKAKKMGGM